MQVKRKDLEEVHNLIMYTPLHDEDWEEVHFNNINKAYLILTKMLNPSKAPQKS
jgi:hypothetical protein